MCRFFPLYLFYCSRDIPPPLTCLSFFPFFLFLLLFFPTLLLTVRFFPHKRSVFHQSSTHFIMPKSLQVTRATRRPGRPRLNRSVGVRQPTPLPSPASPDPSDAETVELNIPQVQSIAPVPPPRRRRISSASSSSSSSTTIAASVGRAGAVSTTNRGPTTPPIPNAGNFISPPISPRAGPSRPPPLIPVPQPYPTPPSRPLDIEDLCQIYLSRLEELRFNFHQSKDLLKNQFFEQVLKLDNEHYHFQ